MITSLKDLCEELKLPTAAADESQLIDLEAWIYENISRDIFFEESGGFKYTSYLSYAENYLDKFLKNIPSSLSEKIACFNNMSTIQYASEQGYHYFLANLPTIDAEVINESDSHGMTALHNSAIKGYLNTVRVLVEKGANINQANAQKQLPIQCALFVPILHLNRLIQRKAKIFSELLPLTSNALSLQDNHGDTLLHKLANSPFHEALVDVVNAVPQLAFVKNKASRAPIHTAILNYQRQNCEVLLALEGGATITDAHKATPLHYAAQYGDAVMIECCCKITRMNLNDKDRQGNTALLLAAVTGNLETLVALINKGADPSIVNNDGFSILHISVRANNSIMSAWLVENIGVRLINLRDNAERIPLYYATKNNNNLIEKLLLDNSNPD